MATKLACRLGRHDWTTRVEGGESYKELAVSRRQIHVARSRTPSGRTSSVREPKNLGMGWVSRVAISGVVEGVVPRN